MLSLNQYVEMLDTSLLAIVIILMMAFAAPLIINSRKNRLKESKAKQRILEHAHQHDLSINTMEFWRKHYFIGLDQTKGQLIYVADIESAAPLIIDLWELRKVRIQETSHQVKNQGASCKVIDHIDMVLEGEVPGKTWTLEVYDGDRFSNLVSEPVIAKVWQERIQQTINHPSLMSC